MASSVFVLNRRIITSHLYPPIPYRDMDWLAYYDGEEEGLQGWGKTKTEAIDNLKIATDEAEE